MNADVDAIKSVMANAVCLFNEKDVEQALDKLAVDIGQKLKDANPIVICVMNGGLVPLGKLLTRLDFQLQVDYLHATRYREKTSGSDLRWKAEPSIDLRGRVVLVVDDILDEGITLKAVVEYCNNKGAKKVYTAVLVEKLHQRKLGLTDADFIGLRVEDKYVFGYGMDYKGFLRNAPGIYAVK